MRYALLLVMLVACDEPRGPATAPDPETRRAAPASEPRLDASVGGDHTPEDSIEVAPIPDVDRTPEAELTRLVERASAAGVFHVVSQEYEYLADAPWVRTRHVLEVDTPVLGIPPVVLTQAGGVTREGGYVRDSEGPYITTGTSYFGIFWPSSIGPELVFAGQMKDKDHVWIAGKPFSLAQIQTFIHQDRK